MKVIDHIGLAVRNLENAIQHYNMIHGAQVVLREELPEHGVRVAFVQLENCLLELLSPIQTSGPLHKFLDNKGEGVHHICYRVSDIEKRLNELRALGIQLIDQTPRIGSRGAKVAFIHPKSMQGILTELCQLSK